MREDRPHGFTRYGAEVIKICATGGVFSRRPIAPGAQQLTYEEMKAIADEAHMLGLQGRRPRARRPPASTTRSAPAIDTIEHASLASDATIKLAKQHGTWFDMDIYNDDYILATGAENGTAQESLDKEQRDRPQAARDLPARASRAGVKMLFGTDAGAVSRTGENALQFAQDGRSGE